MKHLTINDIDPSDYRFIIDKPDKAFSPEKNYQVIKEVIEDGTKVAIDMWKARQKEIGDRVDILSTYGKYALNGGEKKFEDYMGREWMKQIYGEKILEKLRIADSIKRLNRAAGNDKYENFYLK